jgi:hypothetical protein
LRSRSTKISRWRAASRSAGVNVTDGRVQPHGVVMVNEVLDKSSAILLGKRTAWPETIGFEALVPPLDFPVALRVVRGGFDMVRPVSWKQRFF